MFEFIVNNQEIATLVFSAVVALSTVIYAVLTALLVTETRQMRRAQTEPKLVAFIELREEFVNFAHLYIQNVGAGPAFNVSFKLSASPDDEGGNILIDEFSESKFLETGIDYVGPNQKIQSRHTEFTKEFDKKIKAVFTVTIIYKTSSNREIRDSYKIDMSQFEGACSFGTPHLYSIAQSLNKMKDDVHHIATGFKRLKVDTYSSEDRLRENVEREERRKEQIAKQKSNEST